MDGAGGFLSIAGSRRGGQKASECSVGTKTKTHPWSLPSFSVTAVWGGIIWTSGWSLFCLTCKQFHIFSFAGSCVLFVFLISAFILALRCPQNRAFFQPMDITLYSALAVARCLTGDQMLLFPTAHTSTSPKKVQKVSWMPLLTHGWAWSVLGQYNVHHIIVEL